MSSNSDKVNQTVTTAAGRSIIPFTGGLIIFVYAFFWPVQYGTWLGSIVKAFRVASGI